eukprot:6015764-Amphidinium_carterae.1
MTQNAQHAAANISKNFATEHETAYQCHLYLASLGLSTNHFIRPLSRHRTGRVLLLLRGMAQLVCPSGERKDGNAAEDYHHIHDSTSRLGQESSDPPTP